LVAQLAVKIGCTAPEKDTLVVPQVHVPLVHVWPGLHTFPHLPQLLLSLAVRAHVVPQSVPPFVQAHVPDWHSWALGQTFPHLPQLPLSPWAFTQVDPQSDWPLAQAHVALTHDVPPEQACPHVPQLRLVCGGPSAPKALRSVMNGRSFKTLENEAFYGRDVIAWLTIS
jgi:hypothetical protein